MIAPEGANDHPATAPAPTATGGDPLTAGQQGIADSVTAMFAQYGLESLAPIILGYAQEGYDGPTIQYLLTTTDAYKKRFSGNEIRIKNGYAALDPKEYLALEGAYRNVSKAYNLPADFYDSPGDFANLIGNDLSANEYERRAQHAFKYTQQSDPAAKALLMEYYGISDSQITAYFLDPTKAQAIIDRQSAAIDIGQEAARQGLAESRSRAEGFADQGISTERAAAGYGEASLAMSEGQLDIAKRFGSDLSQNDLTDEFVGGLASARRKREKVNESETNLFQQNGASERAFAQESLGSY